MESELKYSGRRDIIIKNIVEELKDAKKKFKFTKIY